MKAIATKHPIAYFPIVLDPVSTQVPQNSPPNRVGSTSSSL